MIHNYKSDIMSPNLICIIWNTEAMWDLLHSKKENTIWIENGVLQGITRKSLQKNFFQSVRDLNKGVVWGFNRDA